MSQFLKINLLHSLSIHRPCEQASPGTLLTRGTVGTAPLQGRPVSKGTFRFAAAQVITDTVSQVQTVDTPRAVEGESFVQYLPKSLARPCPEGVGASTPSPAEAEGRDACAEAGGGRSEWAAAGEALGTQRENYSQ